MTTVSVVTTFYNASSTIRGTIESIIKSDFDDFEIILVDDGSTDTSTEIISEINDSRIKLYKPGRVGRSIALNIGIDKAVGKYIAILDADDLCLRSRLSIQVSMLDSHPEYSLVYSNAELIDFNGDLIGFTSFPECHDEIVKCLFDLNPFPHSSVMYRRECALKIGGYNTRCEKSIDYNFYLELLSEEVFFKGVNDPLIQLRNHENSWGKNDTKALQIRFGILGLINFYQKQHDLQGILELDDQNWKSTKLIFDFWFGKMRFQQQIQAKHLFAGAKNNLRHFDFIKATKKLFDLIGLDPWFWRYRGCNFIYLRDVKYFIDFLDNKLKNTEKL
ncbi:glycosyltransferase [Candidatus Pseudothioglobus singularis]|jgi:glycosyltransferase involved in cell wall biosynthesis|nr:glycosyltransferase [Candidatus Pseudothioglobus singularis]